MTGSYWWQVWTKTLSGFGADKVPRLGAALAFYTTFSVAPLLTLAVAISSRFFGEEAVQGQLKRELLEFVGQDGAAGIQAMLAAARREDGTGSMSSALGVAALVFGATGVFVELKDSMNTIWGVELRDEVGWWRMIWDRAASFAMILTIAFLLLVSMILSTVISVVGSWATIPLISTHITDFVVSIVVITLLFTLIFKFLPDARINWADVWIGALMTSMLFAIGKQLIGIYLGKMALTSAYGAVGSLMIFLLWTYYSSQILFLGAEFTKAHAAMRGRTIAPKPIAQATDVECRSNLLATTGGPTGN